MHELPLNKDLSLEDTIGFHEALVASGATITEINTVRKYFSPRERRPPGAGRADGGKADPAAGRCSAKRPRRGGVFADAAG